MCFDQEDSQIHQERIRWDLGRVENKIDHLTTMAEEEVRCGLREQREEYTHKQRGQKKPMKIKKSRTRKHSTGLTISHADKETLIHVRRLHVVIYGGIQVQPNGTCYAHGISRVPEHGFSEKKAGMDRLDRVSNVRKIDGRENSWRNDTELHRMRVVEQSKRVQEMDEIGPRNVGTCDASRAFLSRPNNDPNRFCLNLNWNKSIED